MKKLLVGLLVLASISCFASSSVITITGTNMKVSKVENCIATVTQNGGGPRFNLAEFKLDLMVGAPTLCDQLKEGDRLQSITSDSFNGSMYIAKTIDRIRSIHAAGLKVIETIKR